jgi:hypothetical protein
LKEFFCLLLFEGVVHLDHFSKKKSPKEVTLAERTDYEG